MGILLDETATEDDYVAPEYDVLDYALNYANEPMASLPEFLQSDFLSNIAGNFGNMFGDVKDQAWNGNGIYDSLLDRVIAAPTAGAAWLAEESANIFKRGLAGEELSPLEILEGMGLTGAGGYKAVQGIRQGLSNKASGLGITRGAMPYEDPKDVGPGWYDNPIGKAKEMGKMVGTIGKQVTKNIYDPRANVLWNKYGISQTEADELAKVISDMQTTGGSKSQHINHLITQMQSNKTLRDKFGAKMPEFLKDMEHLLFPKSVTTKGADMLDSSVPLQSVLPDTGLPPEVIREHLSAPMIEKLGMDKANNIQLQTKVWESNPLKEVTFNNLDESTGDRVVKQIEAGRLKEIKWRGDPDVSLRKKDGNLVGTDRYGNNLDKTKLATQVLNKFAETQSKFPSSTQTAIYLWKTAPKGSKFDYEGFEALLKANNTKYAEGVDGKKVVQGKFLTSLFDLTGEMLDSGDYISFGGKRLGADKLLGTYDTRFVVNKKTGEGYLFVYDEMQLGSGSKRADKLIVGGSQEQVYVDFFKLTRSDSGSVAGGKSAAEVQRGVKSADLADDIAGRLTDVLDNGVTPEDIRNFKMRRGIQVGSGALGTGIGSGVLGNDED